jgi:hypothetical protein
LFTDYLKYVIGTTIIAFIIIEPMSMAKKDSKIDAKIGFDAITESADLEYFSRIGEGQIVEKLYGSEFYKDYAELFETKEDMIPSVYSVIREQYWDATALNEIETQLHMLNVDHKAMFYVLHSGIRASRFICYSGLEWYFTSFKSNYKMTSFNTGEIRSYMKSLKL